MDYQNSKRVKKKSINTYLLYTSVNKKGSIKFFIYLTYYLYIILNTLDAETGIKLYIPNFKLTRNLYYELLDKLAEYNQVQTFYGNIEIIEIDDKDIISKIKYKKEGCFSYIEIDIIKDLIPHNQFLSIIQESNVIGCTGDQSISEVIALNKNFFYEILQHKESFFQSIIELSSKIGSKYMTDYLEYHRDIFKSDLNLSLYLEKYKLVVETSEFAILNNLIYQQYNIVDTVPGNIKSIIIQKLYPDLFTEECNLFISMLIDTNKYIEWNNWFVSTFESLSKDGLVKIGGYKKKYKNKKFKTNKYRKKRYKNNIRKTFKQKKINFLKILTI